MPGAVPGGIGGVGVVGGGPGIEGKLVVRLAGVEGVEEELNGAAVEETRAFAVVFADFELGGATTVADDGEVEVRVVGGEEALGGVLGGIAGFEIDEGVGLGAGAVEGFVEDAVDGGRLGDGGDGDSDEVRCVSLGDGNVGGEGRRQAEVVEEDGGGGVGFGEGDPGVEVDVFDRVGKAGADGFAGGGPGRG